MNLKDKHIVSAGIYSFKIMNDIDKNESNFLKPSNAHLFDNLILCINHGTFCFVNVMDKLLVFYIVV